MKDHAFQVAINQKYRDKVKPGDGRSIPVDQLPRPAVAVGRWSWG